MIQEIIFYGVRSICSQGGGVHMAGGRGIDGRPSISKLVLKVINNCLISK